MPVVDMHAQAVRGVTAPATAEARIASRYPAVSRFPFVSKPAAALQEIAKNLIVASIKLPWPLAALALLITLPLGTLIGLAAWAMLAPFYFMKILPIFMTRYVVTNKRVMIQKGWSQQPAGEASLLEMDEVRIVPGSEQPFYLSADLEFVGDGKVLLTMPGVPEFQQFKINVESAYLAWGRKDPPKEQIHPASEKS
jgi:hypothetical protein